MKKRYLSDLIGDRYEKWGKKKILLTAPTGLGKTTFIIEVLLSHVKERNKKILILCNRKLLRLQYWKDLMMKFSCFEDLKNTVELKTYQQLAEELKRKKPAGAGPDEELRLAFVNIDYIVLDEAHYFYADSDFNGDGTFSLLQSVIYAGMAKTMVFMSATMEEVKPLIEQTIHNCLNMLCCRDNMEREYRGCGEIIEYDYSHLTDYSRFNCLCVPDEETLCRILAESENKTLFFIDHKRKAEELKQKLLGMNLQNCDVEVLHADNLDNEKNSAVIKQLAIAHRILPHILITTAVLDNGVSVHDPDVENLVIITESRVSFLQMLGRLRVESTEKCNLIFLLRDSKTFEYRKDALAKEMEMFEMLERKPPYLYPDSYEEEVWNRRNKELMDFYGKALVYEKHRLQFYKPRVGKVIGVYGNKGLFVNEFAKKKTGDMFLSESRFFYLAEDDPLKVIYEQLAWIGKTKEELVVLESTYVAQLKKQFIEKLLSVKNFSSKDIKEFKRRIVKEYRGTFFSDILSNNGTLSGEKLEKICSRYGLAYKGETHQGHKYYSIEEVKGNEE